MTHTTDTTDTRYATHYAHGTYTYTYIPRCPIWCDVCGMNLGEADPVEIEVEAALWDGDTGELRVYSTHVRLCPPCAVDYTVRLEEARMPAPARLEAL